MSPNLDWLEGFWSGKKWGGTMEETWTSFAGNCLLGTNRLIQGDKTPHIEFMTVRVEGDEAILSIYLIKDAGKGVEPVQYRLTEHRERRAVFENPAHHRLSRMVYERDTDLLAVRLEGVRESQPYHEEILLARLRQQGF